MQKRTWPSCYRDAPLSSPWHPLPSETETDTDSGAAANYRLALEKRACAAGSIQDVLLLVKSLVDYCTTLMDPAGQDRVWRFQWYHYLVRLLPEEDQAKLHEETYVPPSKPKKQGKRGGRKTGKNGNKQEQAGGGDEGGAAKKAKEEGEEEGEEEASAPPLDANSSCVCFRVLVDSDGKNLQGCVLIQACRAGPRESAG